LTKLSLQFTFTRSIYPTEGSFCLRLWEKSTAVVAITAVLAIFGAVAFAPGIHAQETGAAPKPQSVAITPNGTKVHVGDKVQFTAIAKDASGAVLPVRVTLWSADPFDIAGTDQSGLVTFHLPGEVTVAAIVAGKTGYAHVTVLVPPPATAEISAPTKALVVGASAVLTATARSADGKPRTDVPIHWKSKSETIAKVDNSGMVTALAPGTATIEATAGGAVGQANVKVVADSVHKISVEPATTSAKAGDVVHFTATPQDAKGAAVKDILTSWSVSGPRGTIDSDGAFVAEAPGTYEITASAGRHSAVASIAVAPRNAERSIEVIGHIPIKNPDGTPTETSEEWVIGKHIYVATIDDKLFVFDVSDPAHPKQLSMLKADARLIDDVSTTPDEKIGVFTRENASTRKNGIVLFDPSDPTDIRIISEFTETVTGGVHSAYINTHYIYLNDDATGSLRVIDFQDPQHPKEVARWETDTTSITIQTIHGVLSSGRFLHDLQVVDGFVYLAYWRDGLVILDVGNGIKGGSPEHPKFVAQYKYNHFELYGNGWLAGTHSVFRYKNYLFVGDEVFPAVFAVDAKGRTPVRGVCHVMDVSDIEHPREVARYEVPEGGVHNFWAENDILYMGDYAGGGRVIDISGELRGDLYAQGREIARLWTGDAGGYVPNITWTWGAQPVNGLIYFNDINSGIWIAKLGAPKYKGSTTAPPLQDLAGTQ
jgi:plastocyanin